MASKLLLSKTGVAGTLGQNQNFPGSDSIRIIQFTPEQGVGFTGTVIVETSIAVSPASTDFTQVATVTFSAHTSNLILELASNAPSVRVRIPSGISTTGSVTVYGDSATRAIQGSQGTTPYTAYVESATKVSGTGNGFKINSPVVASITSDDVVYANDPNKTVTTLLDTLNSTATATTAQPADINVLTGLAAYGLTAADLQRVADTNASSAEINYLSGVTSSIQTQLNSLSAAIPAPISGLTAASNDLNLLAGAAAGTGNFSGKAISSTEIGYLDGLTSNIQTQLSTKRDTATAIGISEISGASISITELNYLQGVTSSVQTQFNNIATTYLKLTGGTLTGALVSAAGAAAAPAIGVGAANAGLYKPTAGGIGVAVAGANVISVDTTGTTFGGGTAKSAYIKHASGTSTNPTYAFVTDTATGISSSGAGIVDVIGNGKIMATFNGTGSTVDLGGPVADNNTVSFTGKFEGEKLLGKTAAAIDLKAGPVGSTVTLYTVPTGRKAIITKIVVEAVTATTVTGAARLDIGTTATGTEIVDNTTNTTVFSTLNAANKAVVLTDFHNIGSAFTTLSAAAAVKAKSTTLDTAAGALTVNVYVFGYEY